MTSEHPPHTSKPDPGEDSASAEGSTASTPAAGASDGAVATSIAADAHPGSGSETPARELAVEIGQLTKVFHPQQGSSRIVALRSVDLQIPVGEVFGLIGPNGAGKSTLMRILATLEPPSFGWAKVRGRDTWEEREEVCRILGFMPELFHLYEELKVEEYLDFFAGAYGIPAAHRARTIDDVIELTDLGVRRKDYCGSLSKGMRQRLLLAKTLIHDPDLLILDEPTSGLDPQARIEFRNIVKTLARMGKTIIISSHILPDLSSFCTSFGIMERGVMLIHGDFETVSRSLRLVDRVEVDFLGPAGPVLEVLEKIEGAAKPKLGDGTVEFGFEGAPEDLARCAKAFHTAGIPITRFVRSKTDLEEIFLRIGAEKVQ